MSQERISNCAECNREIYLGEIMFLVSWSVEFENSEPNVFYICLDCLKGFIREPVTPGGRI